MSIESTLELDDIQSGVLRPRSTPYHATYVIFRIDDRQAGRELIRRLSEVDASAAHPTSPAGDTWVSTALSYQGLKALGVPRASLESFPPEFQQGMAPRANLLEDSGESSSENWEKPLGSADVHVVVTALAPDAERLEAVLKRARRAYQDYRASRQSGGRIVMFCQVRRKRSVSRMGSVTLLSKGVVFPGLTLTSVH